MNLYLPWWVLSIVGFVSPFIYTAFRRPGGDYDMQIDVMLVAVACWCSTAVFTLTNLYYLIWG